MQIFFNQNREISLRGGGSCISNVPNERPNIEQKTIHAPPSQLINNILKHCEALKKYSLTTSEETNNIMNSIQFFQMNDINIYQLSDESQVSAAIDVCLISLEMLLDAIAALIKSNFFYAYWLAEALSEICRVVFKFYTLNGHRYMTVEQQHKYLVQVGQLQEQIKIEAQTNPIKYNIEFELFKIKTILTITPTNSKEGEEILTQFLGGALASGLKLSITDDLIQSIGKGFTYIYNEDQKRKLIRKYEIIYFLDSTKFQILNVLPTVTNPKDILKNLQNVYLSSVSQSKDWEIQYCWLKMLFQIINYKIQLTPDMVTADQWQQLEDNKLQVTYNQNHSILNINYKALKQLQMIQDLPLVKIMSQLQQLLIEGYEQIPSLECQYMNLFKFEQISTQRNLNVKFNQPQYQTSLQMSLIKIIKTIEQLSDNYNQIDKQACIKLHSEISTELDQCTLYMSELQISQLDNCLSFLIPYTIINYLYKGQLLNQMQLYQLPQISFENPETIDSHEEFYSQSDTKIKQQLIQAKQIQDALKMIIELIKYEIVIEGKNGSGKQLLSNSEVLDEIIKFYKQLSQQQRKFNIIDHEKLTTVLLEYKQCHVKVQNSNQDSETQHILLQKLELINQIIQNHLTFAEIRNILDNEGATVKLIINSCNIIIELCEQANQMIYIDQAVHTEQVDLEDDVNFLVDQQVLLVKLIDELENLQSFYQSQQGIIDQLRNQVFNYKQFLKLIRSSTNNNFNTELEELKIQICKQIDEYQFKFGKQPRIEIYPLLNKFHQHMFRKYPAELIGQIVFILKQIGDEQVIQDNGFVDKYKQLVTDKINSDIWRGRQIMTLKVLEIQQYCLTEKSYQIISGILVKMQVFETDKRIRQLFKEPDCIQQLNKVMLENWENEEEKISLEINKSIANMNTLFSQMAQEPNMDKKQKLQKELQKLQSNINEQISNVQSISSSLGITVQFIQDVKKDILRVENKITDIQNSINQVGSDIKYLKGKSVIELFQIRMHKIMQQQLYQNANKVYVPIKTKEKIIQDNREDEQTELFSENLLGDGEINEFVWKQMKDSMLIHGSAGSGKSTAARRIEEFIWGIYQKNMGTQDYIPIIPVFVILPSLKDPLYNAIEETLKSDNYRFDDRQVLQLKEEVESNQFRLAFILDSYDEINPTYIGQNLLWTNKLSKWRCKKDIHTFPKVITTTRNEIFNVQNYWSWFISESNNLNHFKEIRLLKFDELQIDDYIKQYCRLILKQLIIEAYDETSQIESSKYLKQYEQLTTEIVYMLIGQKQQLEKLTKENVDKIIQHLKKSTIINEPIQEEPLKLLRIKLIELWGYKEYKDLVIQLKLMSLLETPFMIEIVLQVLPKINSQRRDKSFIKDNFITRYMISNKNENQEEVQSAALKIFSQLEKSNIFNEYNETMNKWQITLVLNNLLPNIDNTQLIAEALIVNNLTSFDIYLEFLTQYFEKQLQKQKALGINIDLQSALDELWIFAQNLATEMTSKQLTYIEYQPKGLLYKKKEADWKNEFFNEDGDEGVYKKMFRNCIPLTQKFKFHSFMHKSIQEFLVAQKIIGQLVQGESQLINDLKLSKEFGITQFIVNKLSRDIEIQDQLFKNARKCNIIGTSNMIFLLNCMNYSFENKDLTALELEDITLYQANFNNSQLTNSKWKNVNISSCNFNQANLTGVSWKGIYINELPQLNYSQEKIEELEYINSTEILLIIRGDSNLELYSTKQGNSNILLNGYLAITLSIDEQYVLGMDYQRQRMILYNLVDNKQVAVFRQANVGYIKKFTFTQDENILIGAGNQGVYIMELKNIIKEQAEPSFQITDQPVKQVVHQNNQVIIVYENGMTSVYDIEQRKMIQKQKKYTNFDKIQTLAASQEYIAVSGQDSPQIEILLFNTSEHKDILQGHKAQVIKLKFKDIETLVSWSKDCTIKMWNVKTSMLLLTISLPIEYQITAITLSKSGIIMAGTAQGIIFQWDVNMRSRQLKDDNRRQGHTTDVRSIAFSPDGTLLASGSDSGIIKLWETQKNIQLGKDFVSVSNAAIICLCFNHNSSILFSGGTDCQLIGRELINFEIIYKIDGYGAAYSDIYVQNQKLVCRLDDKTVRVYDLNMKQFKLLFNYKNATDLQSLGYENSRINYQHQSKPQILKQGTSYDIQCFDRVLINSLAICYKQGEVFFNSKKFKNYFLYTAGILEARKNPILFIKIVDKDQILIWKMGSLEVWRTGQQPYRLLGQVTKVNAISSQILQGKKYYLTCDYYINIWQPEHSKDQQWKILKKPNEDQIVSMVNCEELIMGGSEFGTIFIWNMIQGELIKEIKHAHAGSINAITIKLQKQWLVSTDTTSEVKFWDYSGINQFNSLKTQQENIKFVYMDQCVLITGTNTEIIIWDSETCQYLYKIALNNEINHHIVYCPMELSLYVSEKDYINKYPLSINAQISNIIMDQYQSSCLSVSDTLIATGSDNGSIFIYNSDGLKEGECILGEPDSGQVVGLSMDEKMLVALYQNSQIKVFHILNRDVIWTLPSFIPEGHQFYEDRNYRVTFCLLLKDGFVMYQHRQDQSLVIINVYDKSEQIMNSNLRQLKGVVSRNNQFIATIGEDKYIRMYSKKPKGWGCSKMISLEPQMMCEGALIKNAQIISHSGMDLIQLFRERNGIKE